MMCLMCAPAPLLAPAGTCATRPPRRTARRRLARQRNKRPRADPRSRRHAPKRPRRRTARFSAWDSARLVERARQPRRGPVKLRTGPARGRRRGATVLHEGSERERRGVQRCSYSPLFARIGGDVRSLWRVKVEEQDVSQIAAPEKRPGGWGSDCCHCLARQLAGVLFSPVPSLDRLAPSRALSLDRYVAVNSGRARTAGAEGGVMDISSSIASNS